MQQPSAELTWHKKRSVLVVTRDDCYLNAKSAGPASPTDHEFQSHVIQSMRLLFRSTNLLGATAALPFVTPCVA
jgi:hypothetical protein